MKSLLMIGSPVDDLRVAGDHHGERVVAPEIVRHLLFGLGCELACRAWLRARPCRCPSLAMLEGGGMAVNVDGAQCSSRSLSIH